MEQRTNKINEKKSKKGRQVILLGLLWLFYLAVLFFLSKIYLADIYFKKSQALLNIGDEKNAFSYVNKAISLNPYEPNYYRGRAKVNTIRLVAVASEEDVKKDILFDLQKAYSLNPTNLVTIRNSIPLYYFIAVRDLSVGPGASNVDEKYIDYTKEFFRAAKRNYWNDVGVISSLAKYEKKLGLKIEYEESLERIEFLRPDLPEWNESFR